MSTMDLRSTLGAQITHQVDQHLTSVAKSARCRSGCWGRSRYAAMPDVGARHRGKPAVLLADELSLRLAPIVVTSLLKSVRAAADAWATEPLSAPSLSKRDDHRRPAVSAPVTNDRRPCRGDYRVHLSRLEDPASTVRSRCGSTPRLPRRPSRSAHTAVLSRFDGQHFIARRAGAIAARAGRQVLPRQSSARQLGEPTTAVGVPVCAYAVHRERGPRRHRG